MSLHWKLNTLSRPEYRALKKVCVPFSFKIFNVYVFLLISFSVLRGSFIRKYQHNVSNFRSWLYPWSIWVETQLLYIKVVELLALKKKYAFCIRKSEGILFNHPILFHNPLSTTKSMVTYAALTPNVSSDGLMESEGDG